MCHTRGEGNDLELQLSHLAKMPSTGLILHDISLCLIANTQQSTSILGRCLQHRGGEPEQAKGADGMQLFALDCIAHIVDAEMDQVFACMNDM